MMILLKEKIKRYYDELEEEKKICDIIKSSNNLNCVCAALGKRATNNNYSKLRKIIKKLLNNLHRNSLCC